MRHRWFLYDSFTELTFSEVLDLTGNERDIDGMLGAFRSSTWIVGLMTMFPWILGPLFNSRLLGDYFLPRNTDKNGVGKIMGVCATLTRFFFLRY